MLGEIKNLEVDSNAISIIKSSLGNMKYVKYSENRITIQCPYHISDTGFSQTLNVNLNPNRISNRGFHVPIGYFHCWSCGRSGSWNTLANKLGFQKLKVTDNPEIENYIHELKYEEDYIVPDSSLLDPIEEPWRRDDCTISVDTLEKAQAKLYHKVVRQNNSYVMYNKILLPCIMNKEQYGHVEIKIEKEDFENKYMNSLGNWSHKYWIGFDVIRNFNYKYKKNYVCIVEGPADYLRMLQYKIPALPMLGVQSWSELKKISVVTAFPHIVIIGDGDNAGGVMGKKLITDIPDSELITLETGTDPASLKDEEILVLKNYLDSKYGTN